MTIRKLPGLVFSALYLSGCGNSAVSSPAQVAAVVASGDAPAIFRQAEGYADQGDTVRAEQYLSMALDRGYDKRQVLLALMRVCLSSSRLRAALVHAEPYLREHPRDVGLRYLVATIHLGLGQFDDARVDVNQILRLDPNNAQGYYLLGIVASEANAQQAPIHFRKYLELAPMGEHAVEVTSRLAELSARFDLSQDPIGESNAANAPRIEPFRERSIAPTPVHQDAVTWFGEVPQARVHWRSAVGGP